MSAQASRMDAARAAIDFMAENDIPPSSENFAVWSSYIAGSNRALCDAVDHQTSNGMRLDAKFSRQLFHKFFSYLRVEGEVLRADQDARGSLDALGLRLRRAVEDRCVYSGALAEGEEALHATRDRSTLKTVVGMLATATSKIEQRSSGLEKDLHHTLDQLERIQADIRSLEAETQTDGLTGLANRKLLDNALRDGVRRAHKLSRPLAFIMCDIDNFKAFNDTWGHPVGDQVIRFVASVLKGEAEASYTVARYGGEEFAVVLPDANHAEAGSYAETVRDRIARKRLTRRASRQDLGHVTISLGVAMLQPGEHGPALMERADDKLYESKARGKNRVTFDAMS